MGFTRRRAGLGLALMLTAALAPMPLSAQDVVTEATIAELHELMLEGRLTARQLVQRYLDRIDAYDRRGPSLNAITVINPNALQRAGELDEELARTGRLTGPLHGIPVIVKDNYDTADLLTAAGSRSLADVLPTDDAFMVRRLREAGAIVIAKSNMAEFAFSPYETVGSLLPGYTFNPYALNRVPAGSSGGTAAAVSASFGAVGLGTDTGNSIRGPSSHTALVGIRPTIGLTSRDGIVPLYLERDVGGPMARTVADAARVLDVVAGYDPADTATAHARDHIPETYTAHLRADALRGARIGVVRVHTAAPTADTAVVALFDAAVRDLQRAGATIIDPVELSFTDSIPGTLCSSFRADIEAYLATRPGAPQTLEAIIESGRFHVTVERRLRSLARDTMGGTTERCREAAAARAAFRERLSAVLREQRLDALVYPTWSNPPRLIGDLTSPHGDNNQVFAPRSGFPAITVPMGYAYGTLPAGLQFLGDAWSEPRLIELAFSYEQATRHRRPPPSTPPLEH
ncbi:MAG TPA: amidase family protein [Longimicrobiales bacterium]|nr:amidase family protein [Longimicrobiales bacterium]